MSYRFLRVSEYYREIFDFYYNKYPEIHAQSYVSQYNHFMGQFFGWSDSFEYYLSKMGVSSTQIVANAHSMQRAWSQEYGINKQGPDLLRYQIKHYEPNIVFFENPFMFNEKFFYTLKKDNPSVKFVTHICAPYQPWHIESLKRFDLTLTCTEGYLDRLRSQHINANLLRHAFDDRILEFIDCGKKPIDNSIVFAGSLYGGSKQHLERKKIILELLKKNIPIKIFSNVKKTFPFKDVAKNTIKGIVNCAYGDFSGIDRIFSKNINFKQIEAMAEKPKFGLDYYCSLKNSLLSFNSHIDDAGQYAGNMRLFEATGMGCCLVTDDKKNLHEMFEPDSEIVTYKNAEEAVEKIKWLIEHRDEAIKIGKKAQIKVLEKHTYRKRAIELNDYILDVL